MSAVFDIDKRVNPDGLLATHLPMIERMAYQRLSKCPPSVDVEDLIQVGAIMLYEAHEMYDESQGASFKTYLGIRLRGAMLDELRKDDWVTRSIRKDARLLTDARHVLNSTKGANVNTNALAELTGMTPERVEQVLREAYQTNASRLNQPFGDEGEPLIDSVSDVKEYTPDLEFEHSQLAENLYYMVRRLSERQRRVFDLRTFFHMTFAEIGTTMGITESRVCQIELEYKHKFIKQLRGM